MFTSIDRLDEKIKIICFLFEDSIKSDKKNYLRIFVFSGWQLRLTEKRFEST